MSNMSSCIECGKPTNSHQTSEGALCHMCYKKQEEERSQPDSSKTLRERIDGLAAIPDPDPDADPETCNHNYTKYPFEGLERCHRCGHEVKNLSIVPAWIKEDADAE